MRLIQGAERERGAQVRFEFGPDAKAIFHPYRGAAGPRWAFTVLRLAHGVRRSPSLVALTVTTLMNTDQVRSLPLRDCHMRVIPKAGSSRRDCLGREKSSPASPRGYPGSLGTSIFKSAIRSWPDALSQIPAEHCKLRL